MTTQNNDKLSVFIQGPGQFGFVQMFAQKKDEYYGVKTAAEADIVLFTGGLDINPELYGEKPLGTTRFDPERDRQDVSVFENSTRRHKFLVGVCRGAQFLNVMNGGRLWQHVGQHTIDHPVVDIKSGRVIPVSSTHHQMMMPNSKGDLIRVAATNQARFKRGSNCGWDAITDPKFGLKEILFDDEVLWYPNNRSLCFQPHPEYDGYPECTKYFFELLDRFFDRKDEQ
jgi:carbamoylphosphate synthase small subunit